MIFFQRLHLAQFDLNQHSPPANDSQFSKIFAMYARNNMLQSNFLYQTLVCHADRNSISSKRMYLEDRKGVDVGRCSLIYARFRFSPRAAREQSNRHG